MSGGGTQTSTTTSGPPQQYLNAYSQVTGQAQNVASTPYSPYPGQTVAGLSPDQTAGIAATENLQGIANPYINAAAQEIGNSTTPLWSETQQFSPGAVQQYMSPYTQDVLSTTEAAENNQDQQQQEGVVGNLVSQGAWGGDRSAVAQGIVAGQQAIANNQTNANIENTGYQTGLNEFNTEQQAQLGANEANNWLSSQAGYGLANLGNEALSTGLQGASALLGVGSLEQGQAQSELNVPYEQYLAQQAYPFQTTGWLANIDEGLGGSSGGTSSTTSPGASVGSQIAGAGLTGLAGYGLLNQTGAFGSNGWLTGSGGGSWLTPTDATTAASDEASTVFAGIARGGAIPQRSGGGGIAGSYTFGSGRGIASHGAYAGGGGIVPNLDISIVPGANGFGDTPASRGSFNLFTPTGSTTTTTGGGPTAGGVLGGAASGAASGAALGSIVPGIGTGIGAIGGGILGGLSHLASGGGIATLASGGGIASPFPVFPHPMRLPSAGHGIANDNHGLAANTNTIHNPFHPARLASGGIAMPMLDTGQGISSFAGNGGVSIPQLTGGSTGTGIAGGSIPAVQSYLQAAQAATYQPSPAPAAQPMPAAQSTSPIPVTSQSQFDSLGLGGDAPISQIEQAASQNLPTATVSVNGQSYSVPTTYAGGFYPEANNSVGDAGGQARGGVVRRGVGGGIAAYDDGGYVTSPEWMDQTIAQESGNDPEAHNPRSSAYGLGQFTDGTWMDEVNRTHPAWAQGKTPNEILQMRSQMGPTRDMMSALNSDNAKTLSGQGLPVNDATMRLAYGFGAGGAHALMTADPNAPAASVLGSSVIQANPDLAGKTVGQVLASRGVGGQGGGGIMMMPTNAQSMGAGIAGAPSGAGAGIAGDVPYHAPNVPNDPWKSLLYAGLGIMGGNSPQAGVNIGRGALEGIQAADREHQTDVAQAGTEAEREFTAQMSNRREGEAARHNQSDEQMQAQRFAQQADEIRNRQKMEDARTGIEQQRADQEAARNRALEDQGRWVSGTGPGDGGQTVPGMYFVPKGGGSPVFHPGVNTTQQANSNLRSQVLQETVKQHGIQNDQRAQAAAQAQIGRMTDEALRIYAGSKDPVTGKYTMTPEQAEQQATDIRNTMSRAQGVQQPSAPASTQDPLGIRQ